MHISGIWHFVLDGVANGPFDHDQILSMAKAGKIDQKTMAWSPTLADWTEVGRTDLAPLLISATTPPPLPSEWSSVSSGRMASNPNEDTGDHYVPSPSWLELAFAHVKFTLTKKYATFSGRESRRDFWTFYLTILVISVTLNVFIQISSDSRQGTLGAGFVLAVVLLVFGIATFIPILAAIVRRLHDVGISGWWTLLLVIPLIGAIILLVLLCRRSDADNEYGSAPSET